MNNLEIRTAPTKVLIELLSREEYQEYWNHIIYELVYRTYVPFNQEGISFDEMLLRFGYRIENQQVQKTEENGAAFNRKQ